MNRRAFLSRLALASGGLLVGDAALEAYERLTHRKVFTGWRADGHFRTVRAGDWNDPRTWGGVVPGEGVTVTIAHEVTVQRLHNAAVHVHAPLRLASNYDVQNNIFSGDGGFIDHGAQAVTTWRMRGPKHLSRRPRA